MKKLILLLLIFAAVFIFITRNRLYIRDPLATVTRDGVSEDGTEVFINFRNEVLLENDGAASTVPTSITLIQLRTPQVIGIPVRLKCIHHVVCLTDADTATLAAPATPVTITEATGRQLIYADPVTSKSTTIKLR